MDEVEVSRWADGLRRALRPHVKLAPAKAHEEACMLWMVSKGIRSAGLVATFATTENTVGALARFLRDLHVSSEENEVGPLFVLVHVASEQTFVVHRDRFLQHDLDRERHAFYSINETEAGLSAQSCPPSYLRDAVGAITNEVKATQKVERKSGHAPSILLLYGHALSGIALAGWLLEYTVIYVYTLEQDHRSVIEARWHDETATEPWSLAEDVDSNQGHPVSRNNLSNIPLTVFDVQLCSRTGPSRPVMQFTIPSRILDDVKRILQIGGEGSTPIAQYINGRFKTRIPAGSFIDTKWRQEVMDRVAM